MVLRFVPAATSSYLVLLVRKGRPTRTWVTNYPPSAWS